MTRKYYLVNDNVNIEDDELAQTEFYYCRDCYHVYNNLNESIKM